MKNNKFVKFLSTVLVAILIVTIAPINDAVASEMKSSANVIVKNIGEAVEKIDLTLPEFDIKADAMDISDIPGASILLPPQKKPFTYEIKVNESKSILTITCSGEMPSYSTESAPWRIYRDYENLVIKGDVENIGEHAFKNFTNLKKVTIEAPVKRLNYEAFYGCTALTSVKLPGSLEKIYNEVFEGCSSLKTIKIPNNVTSIGSSVFRGCPLKSMTIPFTGGGPDNEAKDVSDELGYIFGTTEFNDSYPAESKTRANTIYYVPNTLKTLTITDRLDSYGISNCGSIEKVVFAESLNTTYVPTYFACNADGLETIVFNSKIKTLAVNCFRDCYNLRKVTLPEQLTIIGAYAFINCENLESVVIGENIQAINDSAFYNCKSLSSVEFPNKIFNVYHTSFEKTPWFDNLTDEFCTVGDSVLIKYNGTATEVVIPDGIKAICGAFSGKRNIKTIALPESLVHIGPESFFGCYSVHELYIPDSVEVIEAGAFYGLCTLNYLSVPFVGRTSDAAEYTSQSTFGHFFATSDNHCQSCNMEACNKISQKYDANNSFKYTCTTFLKKVTVRGNTVKPYAFNKADIREVVLEEAVSSIGKYSFCDTEIGKYTLNCNVKEIPDYAFAFNYDITDEFELPKSAVRIGKAFVDCDSLKNITIPEGVKIIDGTFRDCGKLENVLLPESLEEIRGATFSGCPKLSVINIDKNVRNIDFEAFFKEDTFLDYISYISEINVNGENPYFYSKDGVLYTHAGELFFYPEQKTTKVFNIGADVLSIKPEAKIFMKNIEQYTVDKGNPALSSVDGVLYNKDLTQLIKCPSRRKESYIAPESVVEVATYAFFGCYFNRLEITNKDAVFEPLCFENSVQNELIVGCFSEVLKYYFKERDATRSRKLVLTNQTVSIPDKFAKDWRITELGIYGNFETIGKYAFYGTEITTIKLPDSVKIIDEYAFADTPLEEIDLGTSLECIKDFAFYYTQLSTIDFPETLTTICSHAFTHTRLREIIFPESIVNVAENAFGGTAIKRVVLNESILSVVESVFENCNDLEIVVIGGAVEEIKSKSFAECPSLKTVVIPDGVEKISKDAFENSSENLTIYCNENSYAESYAKENNIQYTTLVLDSIENQVYTGEEIRPVVGASANGKKLTLDSEYTIDYKNNINAGSAKIIARGLGDFKALIAVGKFTILPKEMENIIINSQDSEFDMVKVDFNVDVFVDDVKLTEGVDYNLLTETKFCDVGENNIAVCGIGNYTGIINVIVNVVPRNINKATIEIGDKIVVTDKGEKLLENVEYTVTEEIDENGKKVILITGIGNYDGFVVCSEKERYSNSFIDRVIEFLLDLIEMLMM